MTMPSKPTPKTVLNDEALKAITSRLLSSRKYKGLGLPKETISDLIEQNLPHGKNTRDIEKVVRQKLHNIIAPYLETLDYAAAGAEIKTISPDDKEAIEEFCVSVLEKHASTRERLPIMTNFYRRIFELTGIPGSILDLACGLNPFALPFMNLPFSTSYRAYDLHQPRIQLINDLLALLNRPPLAEKMDILVDPPKEQADVAFFFKEAHRFEQRQHGCNRAFWESLNVKYLLVSLPSANLTGSHSMIDGQRILVERTLKGLPWAVHELIFETEIVFCIDKGI
jgi:16S rRNA (guanine(1405)-N(7))-methyltransferase